MSITIPEHYVEVDEKEFELHLSYINHFRLGFPTLMFYYDSTDRTFGVVDEHCIPNRYYLNPDYFKRKTHEKEKTKDED